MRSISSLFTTSAALHVSYALQMPGILQLEFSRSQGPVIPLRKRADGTVLGPLLNTDDHLMYTINVTVGTPPQSLALQLDTGSSDTWMPASNTQVCAAGNCTRGSCQSLDSYKLKPSCSLSLIDYFIVNISASSTAMEDMPGQFFIQYGDNSAANGDYIVSHPTKKDISRSLDGISSVRSS